MNTPKIDVLKDGTLLIRFSDALPYSGEAYEKHPGIYFYKSENGDLSEIKIIPLILQEKIKRQKEEITKLLHQTLTLKGMLKKEREVRNSSKENSHYFEGASEAFSQEANAVLTLAKHIVGRAEQMERAVEVIRNFENKTENKIDGIRTTIRALTDETAQLRAIEKDPNRYSPYYDPDKQEAAMTIDPKGSWVHVSSPFVHGACCPPDPEPESEEPLSPSERLGRAAVALEDATQEYGHQSHGIAMPEPGTVAPISPEYYAAERALREADKEFREAMIAYRTGGGA